MVDRKLKRNEYMRVAYTYARMGNSEKTMEFINNANQWWPLTKAQFERADLLLKANRMQSTDMVLTSKQIERM